ncbi:leucine-rich repeat-containing [Anaeramoeba flamelloides]|uniref:Leucine-rich repeat-containing n=1 Tax=Anaeramoeba flamelloides TaxID=1746091 RepID=A0AAV7ZEY5_9EUKA|nr:leucine-rich repeat-containing [Anaeramoeba flamelloides]
MGQNLTSEIKHLNETRARTLDASSRGLVTIDASIPPCPNLIELNLSNNKISSIPSILLKDFASLRIVDISYNKICQCTALIELNLNDNEISFLPDNIGDLELLRKLYVHKNNLKTLPDSIGNLVSLIELDVGDNNLSELNVNIFGCSDLRYLDASNNTIPSISGEAIKGLSRLTCLNFGGNELTELPEEMSQLVNLKELLLYENKFSYFPRVLTNLWNLEILDLNNNEIKEVPMQIAAMLSLKNLSLAANSIRNIPKELSVMTHLQQLNLQENPLVSALQAVFQYNENWKVIEAVFMVLSYGNASKGAKEFLEELEQLKEQFRKQKETEENL